MVFWITRILIILIFLFIIGFIYRLYRVIYFEKRIKRYSVINQNDDISVMDKAVIRYKRFVSKFSQDDKLQKHSTKYQKYITLGETESPVFFLLNKLIIGFVFTVLVVISSLLSGKLVSFIGLVLSFIVGYYIYDIYLYFSLKRKKKKIKNDMLRAVILMNNSFKAGKSIMQAVYIASEELPKPINLEFKRIYQDMSYGLSADVAFGRFSNRIKLEEANYIASSLAVLNKTGGNIVSVFNAIEKSLYDKKKLENELKTSSGASRLVVKFLMGVPVVFVMFIYAVSPHYFDSLFSSFLGYFLLFIIWLMFVIYIYLLNKILKVKV